MRFNIFMTLLLAGWTATARADEQFRTLQVGDDTFTNVTITKITATDVYFFHDGGMSNAKLKKLSPALQKHFHYDPEKAGHVESKQAANQAGFNAQAARQPVVHTQDTGDVREKPAKVSEALWRNDFPGALKQAQSDNKLILLDFTGSDWCPWCIKFDQEVLSTPKFAAYAGAKLELVKVDFPHHTPLPEEQRKANEALAKRFNVNGYPTYVLLNAAGNEMDRQVGYLEGGPDAFIAELESFAKSHR